MLSDSDKQRLQAGFDGELTAEHWRQTREEFTGSHEAEAYLGELEALRDALAGAPDVPVPEHLAASIKQQLAARIAAAPEEAATDRSAHERFGAGRPGAGRPAVNLVGGLALAASLLLAVGLGVQFLDWPADMDSHMRSRMTGTLMAPAAQRTEQQLQWPGGELRALLQPSAGGLELGLEVAADRPVAVRLEVAGEQWRWQGDHTTSAGPVNLQLERGEQAYRLALKPAGDSGVSSPARIEIAVQREERVLGQAVITAP